MAAISAEEPKKQLFGQRELDQWALRAARSARKWDPHQFTYVTKLHDAEANQGVVDLMHKIGHGRVAVKRMPLSWACRGPREFNIRHPGRMEQPWRDLGILAYLNRLRFPFVCDLLGVFHDDHTTYVVSSLGSEGDLLSWVNRAERMGAEYEADMKPIVFQIFIAMQRLHELGIAHRDVSIENVLLTYVAGRLVAKIIDFAMATVVRVCGLKEVCGKASYRAPDMYLGAYDAFRADNFALGVLLLTSAAQEYPWKSTERGCCVHYKYFRKRGLRAFFRARRSRKAKDKRLADIISPSLVETLEGLLQEDPDLRTNIGESCFGDSDPISFWETEWAKERASFTPCPSPDAAGA
jgi:serine/threonine protein kinase